MLNIQQIRNQFPILRQEVNGHPLIYFDNAATSQKPQVVIDSLIDYYQGYNSNVHRGAHALAEKATAAFEQTRLTAQAFLGAAEPEEIILTKGTTEAINLVAHSYGRTFVEAGDEIVISGMEHHSNIVPWQILCETKGATLRVIPVTDEGTLDYEAYDGLLSERTKLVAVGHVSNALGTINDLPRIIAAAHAHGAVVLIDGAQSSPHFEINVQQLDCDFFVFSSHKVYGPTGIGILYGKRALLEKMPPYMGGGEMIKEVSFEKTTYNELPFKFEAGTPNIADAIAFNTAMNFVKSLGKQHIAAHENRLLEHATRALSSIPGLRIVGTAPQKVSVVSFNIEGMHPFDVGMMLDARGIAVRTGHHCTMPLMQRFGIEGTARASFAIYNTVEEIDTMAEALHRIASRRKNVS